MATKRLSQAEKARRQEREREKKRKAALVKKAQDQVKRAEEKRKKLLARKVTLAQAKKFQQMIEKADALLLATKEHLREVEIATGKRRQKPRVSQAPEESVITTNEENRLTETMEMYRQKLASGEIEAVPTITDFDLDTSPRGAIASKHIPIDGMTLTESNIEEMLHRAREAVAEAKAWNKQVYAVVHMFQSEPTYEKNTDIGRAGGKPDGWIWEDPKDPSKRIFSTWQGVKATDPDGILANLETRLHEIVRANGKKNIALVHEIVFRSVVPNSTTEQQRVPNRSTMQKVVRMNERDEDEQ